MTAREQLLGRLADPEFHEAPRSELEPLWLAAANERLALQRKQIPVLSKLADDLGISEIRSLEDLVPLLFAHSNYKSYPDTFMSKGRWDLMNRWLDTLSSTRVGGFDVDGLNDQDDWLDRLNANGHHTIVTTGTSGKNSFLPATAADRDFALRNFDQEMARSYGEARNDRVVFILGPKYGPHRSALHFRRLADTMGRPDAVFFLTEDRLRLVDLSRMSRLRAAIGAGTAKPSEIAALQREGAGRQEAMAARLDGIIDELVRFRHDPMILIGPWAQLWTIVQRARARGIAAGDFHPDTRVAAGGGTKGANLPEDFQEQILGFFGMTPADLPNAYGMSELSVPLAGIDGRYRPAPWVIPLLLDDSGEKLIQQDHGTAEGRFAFFDIATEGRWGGVITGDRVNADFSTPNTSIVYDSITRYSELQGGDDRLTCAGTIDTYVRGIME
jgi:hypothetical protein